jgi:hypothetical protein
MKPGFLKSPALALFLLLTGIYLATMSGHLYAKDEETLFVVTQQLVDKGTFALPAGGTVPLVERGGTDGRSFSLYGPGQSLAQVPFYWAASRVAAQVPPEFARYVQRLLVAPFNALVTAATAALLVAFAARLGYARGPALGVGLLYGLTSLAWPHGRTLFSEPLTTLLLLAACFALLRGGWRWWALAGLCAGAMLTVKIQAALAGPVLALYGLLCWQARRPSWLQVGREAAAAVLAGLVPLALLAAYQAYAFGDPFESSYGGADASLFRTELSRGAYGLLLSPGKGLLWYSPTLALLAVGLPWFWRQRWREALLCTAMAAVHVLFYARLLYWHGDGAWGPRYMTFVLPFLYLPLAAALAWRPARGLVVYRSAIGLLVVAGLLVQTLPLLLNFNTYIAINPHHSRYWRWAESPLVNHPTIWAARMRAYRASLSPPPGQAFLVGGFSYSEGDRAQGELLPRWTNAEAQVRLTPAGSGPVEGLVRVGDHRPWPLERARFQLLLDGQPLEGVERVDATGEGIVWELRFRIEEPRSPTLLTIQSDTWNPTVATTDNPRNEDLGLFLERLELRSTSGEPLALREWQPVPNIPRNARSQRLWFYDLPNAHLSDVWLWYLLHSGLPASDQWLLMALVLVPAALLVLAGLLLLRLRPGTHGSGAAQPTVRPFLRRL